MSDSERGYLQPWQNGREDEFDLFGVETEKMYVFGVEVSGIIYYVVPTTAGDEILVFITLESEWRKIIETLLDVSVPRFEVFAEHCPKLCQAALDGFTDDSRYDRGAFATIDNAFVLAREVAYDFKGALNSEDPSDAIVSRNIVIVVKKLIDLHNEIIDELKAFDGFSTAEEIRISAREVFDGARMGWRWARIMSFLGM